MNRLSRASLWTLIGASLTASGCADILGFKDFADEPDGGAGAIASPGQSSPNGTSNTSGGANNPSGGGSTGTSNAGGGASDPGGGSTASTSGSSDQGTGGTTGAGTGVSTGTSSGSSADSQGGGGTTGGGSSQSMSGGASSTGSTGAGAASSSKSSTGASSSKSSTGASSSSMTTSAASSSMTTSGGGASGPCTYGTAFNGDGSFTFYFFGQGTAQTSSGNFKTACGYAGTETTGGGLSGQAGSVVDTVPNAANNSPAKDTYFAAIPNSSGTTFDTANFCGACVEITNGGTSVVATIVDECPVGTNSKCVSGHLDLSTQVFDALNYPNGDPSGTTWEFVPCPEGSKNIQAVENSAGQYYLQSSVYPIGTVGGQSIQTTGFFMINPGTYEVTSPYTSETITITIPNGGGDTGANFTAPANCP